ncbi:uncharacterized protein ARMOST_19888 [Armillaria ostoyae]|uniref:Uncharacterized protein n=1 Tax=Armillaria ostoyae TaxID=47428 RepID=A0A284S5X4_ARMOS|nr:uncharacterized protein ARMOST_19888 [Armillaria ostoyae]
MGIEFLLTSSSDNMARSSGRSGALKREHSPEIPSPVKKTRETSPTSTLNSQPEETLAMRNQLSEHPSKGSHVIASTVNVVPPTIKGKALEGPVVLDENTVYLEDIDPSMPKSSPRKDSVPASAQASPTKNLESEAGSSAKAVPPPASGPNANPYQDVAESLVQLTRVNDYIKSRDIPKRVPTVDVAALYRNNWPVIRRIMHIAFAPSKNYLVNLALVDPADFSMHSDRVIRTTIMSQSFSMIGSVVYSDLFGLTTSKQLCIQPLHFLWPRTAAAIGQIFSVGAKRILMNNGYRRGLSFTSWFRNNESKAPDPGPYVPVTGKRHSLSIRPRDQPVPVFDCRAPFKLSAYHLCPADKVDPENGSIVLVIFTLGQYKKLNYNVASYNIQVVLRLANPPSGTDGEKPETPLPTYLTPLEPIGISGDHEDENVFATKDDENDDAAERVY